MITLLALTIDPFTQQMASCQVVENKANSPTIPMLFTFLSEAMERIATEFQVMLDTIKTTTAGALYTAPKSVSHIPLQETAHGRYMRPSQCAVNVSM